MGRKEKLIKELKKRPKTFAFADAVSLLNYLDFVRSDKHIWDFINGKSANWRVSCIKNEHSVYFNCARSGCFMP